MFKPRVRTQDFRWFESFLTRLYIPQSTYVRTNPLVHAPARTTPEFIQGSVAHFHNKRSVGTASSRWRGGHNPSREHKNESRGEQNGKGAVKDSDEPSQFDEKKEPKTGSKRVLRRVHERTYDQTKHKCTAHCTAESYNLELANSLLIDVGYRLDPDSTGLGDQVIHLRLPLAPHAHSEPSSEHPVDPHATFGDLFIFPSGVIVGWAIPDPTVNNIAKLIKPAAEEPKKVWETENLDYVESTRHFKSFMKGDVIVIGTGNNVATDEHHETHHAKDGDTEVPAMPSAPFVVQGTTTVLAKIAFSSGLARSTKLAVLETMLDTYLESTADIPVMMSKGKLGPMITRGFMVKKTGELMMFRAQLNLYSELTDSLPDIFWDSRKDLGLEGCYQDVARELDVKVRISLLNEKLNYASQIAEVLREMLSEAHGFRLEWLIILLILFEVLCGIPNLLREIGVLKEKDSQSMDNADDDGADFRQDINRARQRVRGASRSLEKIFHNRNPNDPEQNRALAEAMEDLRTAIDESNEITQRVRRLRDQLRGSKSSRSGATAGDDDEYSERSVTAWIPSDIRRWGGWSS